MSPGQGGSDFTPPAPEPGEAAEQVIASSDAGAGPATDEEWAERRASMAEPVPAPDTAEPAADAPAATAAPAEADDHQADQEDAPAGDRAGGAGTGPAPQAAPTGGLGPGAQTERFGHPVRQYRMGVSGAALALAWARQEQAPDGATVIVEREVSPLGRLGRMWTVAPESTLSCAIVLRPPLSVEQADAAWLLAGLAAAEGAEAASGRKLSTWWPDLVIDEATGDKVAALKVEIQLGPGKVRSAVASIRIDLEALGLGADGRDAVLEAVLGALDRHREGLGDGPEGVAAAYEGRCGLLGRRVKLQLLPKGETRGLARRVDPSARLELESATGMVQKVAIDNLRQLDAV